ncbi:amidase [Accumulibacter sp.]|uniref:amidase n=1 Tax=Accumulibacter sp. TaxID=2053492 RepID=UPI0028C4DF0A|nr:amidase [Accumulibacter sp.]
MEHLNLLTARQAAQGIRDGLFSSEDLVQACSGQIQAREPTIQAWTYFDPNHALLQARRADEWRAAGKPLGLLHGVPVGVKDIIDTGDMPTEDGTPLHAGRAPWHDAKVVELLRVAGAIVMGKTVTTELATYSPGKTRNPHNPEHTPGGSSSGSAAAVAAGMVPLALGTQTNGSLIRPAAYCGVFGFKPSRGMVSRQGILRQSERLDQVGWLARSVEDLALLGEVLSAYDADEPGMVPRTSVPMLRACEEEPPLPPKLALVKTPWWPQLDADAREGFGELVDHLSAHVGEFELPESTAKALDWHLTIMEADLAASYEADYERGADKMSASLRAQLERGRAITAFDYLRALARIPVVSEALDEVFDRYDAILTPAVAGAAPHGLESTGSPLFCTLWTFCGMPAINLPLLHAGNGLPVGVQLVGRVGDDARLLRTARWLVAAVA